MILANLDVNNDCQESTLQWESSKLKFSSGSLARFPTSRVIEVSPSSNMAPRYARVEVALNGLSASRSKHFQVQYRK